VFDDVRQNNLVELWALFDFVQPGLLGDVREFNREFSNVIEQRNAKDASESDRLLGQQRAEELQELVQPHFLRRDKVSVFGMGGGGGAVACAAPPPTAAAHALQLTATKREWTVGTRVASASAAAALDCALEHCNNFSGLGEDERRAAAAVLHHPCQAAAVRRHCSRQPACRAEHISAPVQPSQAAAADGSDAQEAAAAAQAAHPFEDPRNHN